MVYGEEEACVRGCRAAIGKNISREDSIRQWTSQGSHPEEPECVVSTPGSFPLNLGGLGLVRPGPAG